MSQSNEKDQSGGCVPCRVCGGDQTRGWHLHDRAPATETEQKCPVPECDGGYVRVPVIVEQVNYGQRERFVRMDDLQCEECGGLGRVPAPLIPPGKDSA